MKKHLSKLKIVSGILALALISLAFAFDADVVPEYQDLVLEKPEGDIIVYVQDDEGNFFREITPLNGETYMIPITHEEMLEYMERTTRSSGTLVYNDDGSSYTFIEDVTVMGNCTRCTRFTDWQPNSSWCFRNCRDCGRRETQGHGISRHTDVSATQHNVRCSRCNWNHGNVNHTWGAWRHVGGSTWHRNCTSTAGCNRLQAGVNVMSNPTDPVDYD